MRQQIRQVLDVVRSVDDDRLVWAAVLGACEQACSSNLWSRVRLPDLDRDTDDLVAWIDSKQPLVASSRGFFAGLDTLNMGECEPWNLAVWCLRRPAHAPATAWVFAEDAEFAGRALVRGLADLWSTYRDHRTEHHDLFDTADYLLPLAYAGLLLRRVVAQVSFDPATQVAWGFLEGDVYALRPTRRR